MSKSTSESVLFYLKDKIHTYRIQVCFSISIYNVSYKYIYLFTDNRDEKPSQ